MKTEYITSKNLFLLICDTLKMMDERLVEHGIRVSYIMSKMLECKGGYEKFEIADFMLLAVLHDIGAYKTDDVKKQLSFEAKNPMPHSIYGYLFLKYLSPLEEQSKMILYHHVDTIKIKRLDYKYLAEAEILKVAEIMDIWQKAFRDKFDYRMIERYVGTKFQPEACELLKQAVEQYDIFAKLGDGSYRKEYEESLEYVLLSDEEKEKYLKMLMFCTGLRSEYMVSDTIATIYVSREIGKKLGINESDKAEIYYAALLYDLGMLSIPQDLLGAPRRLEPEEMNLVRTHVDKLREVLDGKISKNIIAIACSHHERFDGSGYPRGLKGSVMNRKEAILQVAESVVHLSNEKPYRCAYSKEHIMQNLNDAVVEGQLDSRVTDILIQNYDEIMKKAGEKAKSALITHKKLKQHYEQVYKNFMN